MDWIPRHIRTYLLFVECGGSAVECRTRNRESPGSNPLCYRFGVLAFSFSPSCPISLSCINEYLAIDGGGHMSEWSSCIIAAWLMCYIRHLFLENLLRRNIRLISVLSSCVRRRSSASRSGGAATDRTIAATTQTSPIPAPSTTATSPASSSVPTPRHTPTVSLRHASVTACSSAATGPTN